MIFLNSAFDPESQIRFEAEIDGSIHNLSELRSQLGLAADATPEATIARAYREWDSDFVTRIHGEYVIAIKDPAKKRLLLLRDRLGIRPLYYSRDGKKTYYATHLDDLLSSSQLQRRPNIESMVFSFFDDWSDMSRSFYEGISRLPPAHTMIVEPGRLRISRYWSFSPGPEIRFRDDREYAERYLELLENAIRARNAGRPRVGTLLSGGLDSSAVSCFAQKVSGSTEVHCFSLKFDDPRASDEGTLESLKNERGLIIHEFFADRKPELFDMDFEEPELFYFPFNSALRAPFEKIREMGIDLVYSGDGADELLTPAGTHYADLFRTGHWLQLHRQMKLNGDGGLTNRSSFRQYILSPLLPVALVRAVRHFHPKPAPQWLNSRLVSDLDIMRRTLASFRRPRPRGRPLRVHSRISRLFTSGFFVRGWENAAALGRRWNFRFSFPLMDLALIEFTLGLPQEQLSWNGREKELLRNAMRGVVPDSVRIKPKFQDYGPCSVDAIHRQRATFDKWIAESRIAALGVTTSEQIKAHWRECFEHGAYSEILRIIHLEKWLRSF